MAGWKPKEIIVHEKVRNDPVTTHFIQQCPGVPVKYTNSGIPKKIVQLSETLSHADSSMLDKILERLSSNLSSGQKSMRFFEAVSSNSFKNSH